MSFDDDCRDTDYRAELAKRAAALNAIEQNAACPVVVSRVVISLAHAQDAGAGGSLKQSEGLRPS